MMCNVNFVKVNLQKTDFRGANLENHLFWGCDLRWANFGHANLTNARIIACDIRYAEFKGANANGLRLDGSVYNSEDYTGDEKAIEASDQRTKKTLSKSKDNFRSMLEEVLRE